TAISALHDALATTPPPRAEAFFKQWQLLFSEVCGYDPDAPPPHLADLARSLGLADKSDPAALLFAVHTYYALFMKLLASEIVAFFHGLPTPLQHLLAAESTDALRRELEALEGGGVFRHIGITNFLEGDLFSWYLDAWTPDIIANVRLL